MERPHHSQEPTAPLEEEDGTVGLEPSPRTGPAHRDSPLVLDRYRLLARLGAGGFGVVWLGHDEKLDREVAVKEIAPGRNPGRAEREARAAARLNHPGIVSLYELAAEEGVFYLVSELVRGRTLGELERAGALSDRDLARIGVALCDALDHAHERGVIHRDVKPSNVMVVAEPAAGAGFAKLTDFGVAHLAGDAPITRTGDVVGTLAYMAPEQAEGQRVTAAADVYSLALTLYEAWAGVNPVRASGPAATARRVGRRLPSLSRFRRDLPPGLCHAIDASLDPHPDRRPRPCDLRRALDQASPQLTESGGLVEPATLERFGLLPERSFRARSRPLAGAPEPPRWTARAAAGGAAGLLALVMLGALAPEPSFSPLTAAAAVALTVALLPRLAWLVAAAAAVGWLASPDAGREGTALVLAAALAPVPVLLPRAGLLWSVPALAPLLGVVALGPLFVAVAGLARTPLRRAGLAAAGFVWLAAGEVLTGRTLLFGAPEGARPRAEWAESLPDAGADALLPLLTTPALLPAALWALLAAVLPLVVRGRSLALDSLGAGAWALALAAGHRLFADPAGPVGALGDARGAVAGAVIGAVVAVSVVAVRPRRPRSGGPLVA